MALLGRVQIQVLRASDTISFHVYFAKEGCILPVGISYLPDFTRRFLQPLISNPGDLSPLINTVCAESPAVEKSLLRLLQRRRAQTSPKSDALQLWRNKSIVSLVLNGPLPAPGNLKVVEIVFTASLDIFKNKKEN